MDKQDTEDVVRKVVKEELKKAMQEQSEEIAQKVVQQIEASNEQPPACSVCSGGCKGMELSLPIYNMKIRQLEEYYESKNRINCQQDEENHGSTDQINCQPQQQSSSLIYKIRKLFMKDRRNK